MSIYTSLQSRSISNHYSRRYLTFIKRFSGSGPVKHHILPKADDMFPEYKNLKQHPWNCCLLSERAHYIAHWLLWKAVGGSQITAFYKMSNEMQLKNSRAYAVVREEHKKKISGEGNPFYGKNHSAETRNRLAELTAERAKGERNPMYGKNHSEESKRKISENKKGVSIIQPKQKQVTCPHCNKRGALNAMNRWHFENCKKLQSL